MSEEKRNGGQILSKDGKRDWLVLEESTGKEGVGFKHRCGEAIMGARVAYAVRENPFKIADDVAIHYKIVPYCPRCETKPNFPGVPEMTEEELKKEFRELVLEIRQYLCNTEFAPEPFTKPVDSSVLVNEFPSKILKKVNRYTEQILKKRLPESPYLERTHDSVYL